LVGCRRSDPHFATVVAGSSPNSRVRSGRSLVEQLVRSAETGFFTEILHLRF
jgi:hypothetical protein